MIRRLGFVALSMLMVSFASGQEADGPNSVPAITGALVSYAKARAAGNPEAVKASVHHDVARRVLADRYWGQPSAQWVRPLNHDQLSAVAREDAPAKRSDPENARADVKVYDVAERSASAIVEMDDIAEIVHLVRFEGEWVIADSVVIPVQGAHEPEGLAEGELDAIRQVAVDYAMGFYEIDGGKVQGTCHSDLSKRNLEHDAAAGYDYLSRITWEEIGLLAETFNRHFGFSPESARKDVEIYYADAGHAAAKLTGASWFDYLHLMKVNGEWKIVNIIFEPLPQSQWQG